MFLPLAGSNYLLFAVISLRENNNFKLHNIPLGPAALLKKEYLQATASVTKAVTPPKSFFLTNKCFSLNFADKIFKAACTKF